MKKFWIIHVNWESWGLPENLTHMVFGQPFWFKHARTQSSICVNMNVLMFLYSHQHAVNFFSLMLFFDLLHSYYFRDLSHKNAWTNHYHHGPCGSFCLYPCVRTETFKNNFGVATFPRFVLSLCVSTVTLYSQKFRLWKLR